MDQAGLWRACRLLLRSLDVQPPLEMAEVCQRVATLRGRPIHLVEYPLTTSLALAWDAGEYDVIVWRPHTSPWHRDHSIAHELGHYLCGHLDPDGARPDAEWAGGFPVGPRAAREMDATPADVRKQILPPLALRPSCRGSSHEETVERVATVLLQWAGTRAPSATHGLSRSLSWRRGWL